jgi:hypothetical protein
MNFCNQYKTLTHLNSWLMKLILCTTAIGISACGGSGSSSTPAPDSPALTLMTAGAYQNPGNIKDWTIILLPNDTTSPNSPNFFALNHKVEPVTNVQLPDIYSGFGQITGYNTATLTQIKLHPYSSAVRSGTGALNSVGSGQVQALINFPAPGSGSGSSLAINQTLNAPVGYLYNTAASLATVQGNWQGILSFGTTNNAYSLNISPTGSISSYMPFAGDCQFALANLTTDYVGTNLFKFTATISDGSACNANTWANQNLTGAGFVAPITEPGKTQRIYLVGVTADGRGVSFKADR